uniref:BglG family transcription antiterminator n=1 Tax=Candidatus Enterococcus willemsii TaxID=1857215 RepID=UPI00403F1953
MSNKKKQLLQVLHDSDVPLTVKTLSSFINTSEKTIRNYIKEINSTSDTPVIDKIGTKYFLKNSSQLEELLESELDSNVYREKTILNKLLTNHIKKFSTFDLADELFISFSTLRNIIAQLNEQIETYDLRIISRNNFLYLNGSIEKQRQLLADIIHEEASNSLYSHEQLINYFEPDFVQKVTFILDDYLTIKSYELNGLAKFNVLVHFLIIINTSSQNLETTQEVEELTTLQKVIHSYLDFSPIQKNLQILEDMILLNVKQKYIQTEDTEELLTFVDSLISELNNIYSLNIDNESFKERLMLHLKNLISRMNTGTYSRNPLKETIIQQSPLIFDIATSCAIIVCKYFHWERLPKDEIAYLALHLGMEISRLSKKRSKIQTLLMIPEYSSLQHKLSAKIQTLFEDDLVVAKQLTDNEIIDESKVDLIITCVPYSSLNTEVVIISPFLSSEDSNKIASSIEKIMYKKRRILLSNQFDKYFSNELFHVFEKENLPQDYLKLITFLCDEIIEKRDIDPKFKEKVFEREKMASTIFKKIAIPHQFSYFPKESSISVVVSSKGIRWNDKEIKLLLLPCISEQDRKEFNQFYEVLLEVFDNEVFLKKLINVNNFADFKSIIK